MKVVGLTAAEICYDSINKQPRVDREGNMNHRVDQMKRKYTGTKVPVDFLADHLGSTSSTTDSSGNLILWKMYINRISLSLIMVCIILFLASCAPNPPAISPTPTVDINSPDYLKECLAINPVISTEQVGYQNIFPGKTDSRSVKDVFGLPEIIRDKKNFQEWSYDFILIEISNNVVSYFMIGSNAPYFNNSLYDAIAEFGCPNVVLAAEDPEGAHGSYEWTIFGYYERGVELQINSFPIESSDSISIINYFKPMTLNDYITTLPDRIVFDWKFVSWEEAVQIIQ